MYVAGLIVSAAGSGGLIQIKYLARPWPGAYHRF